ncbi:hypothetical protein EVAR_52723_1 [Eumeta japonica]|uniref:Uncharacterized protein n=1 Tax=Eumeta variegata TaxID=151549 RepID=A0A4C1ZI85_EUMVA|nr:hypothetical protein EVAR_52723_1 [Eumeta japonica]
MIVRRTLPALYERSLMRRPPSAVTTTNPSALSLFRDEILGRPNLNAAHVQRKWAACSGSAISLRAKIYECYTPPRAAPVADAYDARDRSELRRCEPVVGLKLIYLRPRLTGAQRSAARSRSKCRIHATEIAFESRNSPFSFPPAETIQFSNIDERAEGRQSRARRGAPKRLFDELFHFR